MKTFSFASPPSVAGVYLLKNVKTDDVYIGKSVNLRRRFNEWKSVFVTGLGVKSFKLLTVITDRTLEHWEFLVVAEFPGATEKELAAYETRAISRFAKEWRGVVLNTMIPPEIVKPADTSFGPKSVIEHEGRSIAYTSVAKILGCGTKQLQKRMARYREKGISTVQLEDLKKLSDKYRAPSKT